MIIKFDNTVIDNEGIVGLSQQEKLFDNTFKLGSTVCRAVSLTVNKRYVPTTDISKVYILDDENTALFTLFIDSIGYDNNSNYVFNLVDGMVKLNKDYNWNNLQTKTVGAVLNDICTNVLGASLVTSSLSPLISALVLPNRTKDTTARQLVSFVAEANGGFARINANGDLEFAQFDGVSEEPSAYIDLETCKDILIGDVHVIDKAIYQGENTYQTSNVISIADWDLKRNQKLIVHNEVNGQNHYNIEGLVYENYPGYFGYFTMNTGRMVFPNYMNGVTFNWESEGITDTSSLTFTYPDSNPENKIYTCFFAYDSDDPTNFRIGRTSSCVDITKLTFVLTDYNGRRAFRAFLNDTFPNEVLAVAVDRTNTYYESFQVVTDPDSENGIYVDGSLYIIDTDNVFANVLSLASAFNIYYSAGLYVFYSLMADTDTLADGTSIKSITSLSGTMLYSKTNTMRVSAVPSYERNNPGRSYRLQLDASFEDGINNVLYVNPENILFEDSANAQRILDYLFFRIQGLLFYSFKTTRCEIKPGLRAGATIVFFDGENNYPVISQIDWQYFTAWYGGYDCWLDNKFHSDTSDIEENIPGSLSNVARPFVSGDSIAFADTWIESGYISSSSKELLFMVHLPRPISVSSVSIDSLVVRIRSSSGGYIVLDQDVVQMSGCTITAAIINNMGIRIDIANTNAWAVSGSTVTNNTPISVEIRNGSVITFN